MKWEQIPEELKKSYNIGVVQNYQEEKRLLIMKYEYWG